jgi:hypothetical protein
VSKNYKPFLWCRLREQPPISPLLNNTELVPKIFLMSGRVGAGTSGSCLTGDGWRGFFRIACVFDSHRPLHMDVAHSDPFQFRRSRISGNHPGKIAVKVETRLVSQKRRFRWASMTGQSVNPEQPRGRGATLLELETKSGEESNLAPTYTEYWFLENVNRRGQKSGSPACLRESSAFSDILRDHQYNPR